MKAPIFPTLAVGIAALVTVVAVGLLSAGGGAKKTKDAAWRKKLAWICSWLFGNSSYVLKNVRIPVAVLPDTMMYSKEEATEEGLVECNVVIEGGKISKIQGGKDEAPASLSLDCEGSILLPCFSDAHTHMVKTEMVPRMRNVSGTITEALTIEMSDEPRWKVGLDVRRRMEFAVACAYHHGTRAIRTHLDGTQSADTDVRDAVYEAFDYVRDKYSDKVHVQGVANLFLPLYLTPLGKPHAERAKKHANVVLGAYSNTTKGGDKPDEDTVKGMDALFGFAQDLGMDVDMHIDETNNPDCCTLASLCESLRKARNNGYEGKVVLGHCCSLSLQSAKTQTRICEELAELKAYVISNPFTNLGLQDRQGSKQPHCKEIPGGIARTPQWRGLTLLQELREAGVIVGSASDNVRDHWYPYGDYDMLSVYGQTLAMGHLDTAPSEGAWADIVSKGPAEAMGVPLELNEGEAADLILFPRARHISELLARPQTDRIVLRNGCVVDSVLPDFSELDDLVEVKTEKKMDTKPKNTVVVEK